MFAHVGDWLVVGTTGSRERRRGKITAVGHDGAPPFTVHWIDLDREAVVFPGPDALVLSPEQMDQADAAERHRIAAVQEAILHTSPTAR